MHYNNVNVSNMMITFNHRSDLNYRLNNHYCGEKQCRCEFNSLRVQFGMALCILKLTFDQAMCDQAHRRVQFSQSSTRFGNR